MLHAAPCPHVASRPARLSANSRFRPPRPLPVGSPVAYRIDLSLAGLPPGTYTIEAWHEKLGTSSQTVTLGAKDAKTITFTFAAPATATN